MMNLHRMELAMAASQTTVWDSSIVDGTIVAGDVFWSSHASAILGIKLSPIESFRQFLQHVHEHDRARIVATMQEGIDTRLGYYIEYRLRPKTHGERWLAARAAIRCDEADIPRQTLGMVWDITDRILAERRHDEREKIAEVTLHSIGEGVITTDAGGKVTLLNRAAEALTGWPQENAVGIAVDTVTQLVDEHGGAPREHPIMKCLRLGRSVRLSPHDNMTTSAHSLFAAEGCAAPIRSRTGAILGAVLVVRDVSHERRLRRQLGWQASHDALTGLLNRAAFEMAVTSVLQSAKAERSRHALLFMDLDRFKVVNDTCGHLAGDTLLQQLAKLLQEAMRDSDVLARIGGDELGGLLLRCPIDQAELLADELREKIHQFRFRWGEHAFDVGVSIGIVEIDEDSVSASELLNAADQACYLAKAHGRNRVHVYQESDTVLVRRKSETRWLARLQEAIGQHRFRLFTMPIVPLNGSAEMHEEILIRMMERNGRLVLPGAFIPAAERYSVIQSIDRWVIDAVFRYLASYTAAQPDGPDKVRRVFSINLSGSSIGDTELINYVFEQFQTHRVAPESICFEITETAVVANLSKAQEFIAQLRATGCQFALDDFGSGLSSFAYLKDLRVDYLKIDGVFVRDVTTNPVNRALVKAISDIGHVMHMKTVAEYVESDESLALIAALGIDYAQGHAVGEARPLEMALH